MKLTRIGNRLIVIDATAPAAKMVTYQERTSHRATSQRIVVIKNGQRVGRGPGR
jgi:hypothetical protein